MARPSSIGGSLRRRLLGRLIPDPAYVAADGLDPGRDHVGSVDVDGVRLRHQDPEQQVEQEAHAGHQGEDQEEHADQRHVDVEVLAEPGADAPDDPLLALVQRSRLSCSHVFSVPPGLKAKPGRPCAQVALGAVSAGRTALPGVWAPKYGRASKARRGDEMMWYWGY